MISAPSGTGKSTLIARLMKTVDDLAFSVSWTTRAPRAGEHDGEAYHFTDEATFRRLVSEGAFIEWAEVHGHLYGSARDQIESLEATGKDVILDVDVQGARQVRASGASLTSIFILPPSRELLLARLEGRGSESRASLRRRMADALVELREYPAFDYLVINDDLEHAAEELIAIVRASRVERGRRAERAEAILRSFAEQ